MLSSAELDDEQALLRRVRSGDVEAEGELYVTHVDVAVRRAVQLGAQRADAEDFVAEAFIRVLRQLRKGKGPDGPFRPYLWASLRNVATDSYRGQRGRERPSEDLNVVPGSGAGSDPETEIDISLSVRSAMKSLPPRWREVLWSLHVEGQSPAELAADLGATAQSISALAYRARKALRRAYHEANPASTDDHAPSVGTKARVDTSANPRNPPRSTTRPSAPVTSIAARRESDTGAPLERELFRLVLVALAEAESGTVAAVAHSRADDPTTLSA
jgi:RNA polymerase sigma factor (sigma-70 family)